MTITEQSTGTYVDPICGMEVEAEISAGKTEYEGKTYYFCCEGCKKEFDEHPQDYA